jgi:Fe2+ transport system protein FeoA
MSLSAREPDALTTLAQLKQKMARARVVSIDGDDEISQRIMEMGVIPGVEVVYLGSALFGDPLEIELRGYRLSLRKKEALRISIEPLP